MLAKRFVSAAMAGGVCLGALASCSGEEGTQAPTAPTSVAAPSTPAPNGGYEVPELGIGLGVDPEPAQEDPVNVRPEALQCFPD